MSFRTKATFSPLFRQLERRATVFWTQLFPLCQVTEAAAATSLYFRGSTSLWAEKKMRGTELIIRLVFHRCFPRTAARGHRPARPPPQPGSSPLEKGGGGLLCPVHEASKALIALLPDRDSLSDLRWCMALRFLAS